MILLFYSWVVEQQGLFWFLYCVWMGVLNVFFLLGDQGVLVVDSCLLCMVVNMDVVCLLFIIEICVFGYIYRNWGEYVCLYIEQLFVLQDLLIIMVNLGICVQVIVVIILVLCLVILLVLQLWLIMKLVMFCRNSSGILCLLYSLMKCVFLSVDLLNNMLLLVMILIGWLWMCVNVVIRVLLYLVLNLLNLLLLIICMMIL